MDDFDRLALVAAQEVMQAEHDIESHLRDAARIVLGIALERGWLQPDKISPLPASEN